MRGMSEYKRREVWREMDKQNNQTTGASMATIKRIKRERINGFANKQHFIEYLENTLIPDLKESGSDMTAQDFETAVAYMRQEGQ